MSVTTASRDYNIQTNSSFNFNNTKTGDKYRSPTDKNGRQLLQGFHSSSRIHLQIIYDLYNQSSKIRVVNKINKWLEDAPVLHHVTESILIGRTDRTSLWSGCWGCLNLIQINFLATRMSWVLVQTPIQIRPWLVNLGERICKWLYYVATINHDYEWNVTLPTHPRLKINPSHKHSYR